MLDHDANGNVISIKYNGCYVIVNNGYMSRSTTVPPMKKSILRSEIRFSEWLQSLRKDVECTFGIMKKIWMILKHRIRLHGISNCDRIWLTCCALHNMLLDIDDFCDQWGVESNESSIDVPFAVQRLNNPGSLGVLRCDISGNGIGNDCTRSMIISNGTHPDRIIPVHPNGEISPIVNNVSMVDFRERLIRHFNIVFHNDR